MLTIDDIAVVSLLSARLAHHYGVMPLKVDNGCCQVASANAGDLTVRDDLSRLLGCALPHS